MSKKTEKIKKDPLVSDGGSQPPTKDPDKRDIPKGKVAAGRLRGGSKPVEPKEERGLPPGGTSAVNADPTGGF